MLNNQKIREVIDTITSKAVLTLGRFTDERKAVLDAIREELRKRNYLPILFDFDLPARRNITETVSSAVDEAQCLPNSRSRDGFGSGAERRQASQLRRAIGSAARTANAG
jgi:hypothetical protein